MPDIKPNGGGGYEGMPDANQTVLKPADTASYARHQTGLGAEIFGAGHPISR